jgi:hypothetical protein
MPIVMLLVM